MRMLLQMLRCKSSCQPKYEAIDYKTIIIVGLYKFYFPRSVYCVIFIQISSIPHLGSVTMITDIQHKYTEILAYVVPFWG